MNDLVILGGGCAGLSLAMRLARLGEKCPITTIIESRARYENDRTWCFWASIATRQHNTSRDSIDTHEWVSHQWSSVMLKDDVEKVCIDCADRPYQMLESSIFYEKAQKIIAQNSRITLLFDTDVIKAPIKHNDVWHIQDKHQAFLTKYIVDTRPNNAVKTSDSLMWQSFLGQEVTCETDVFNTDCATLMDFSSNHIAKAITPNEHVAFTYILPITSKRALVEATVFAKNQLTRQDLAKSLVDAISSVTQKKAIKVQRTEYGVLPMGLKNYELNQEHKKDFSHYLNHDKTYIKAGLFFGGARPSSGYAFMRIQRWAESCTHAIASGGLPIGHKPDSTWLNWMDSMFLKVMLKEPSLAHTLFLAMFKKVNASSMVRFLSDNAEIKDYILIILALPPLPFLKQVFRQMLHRE